jgi:hypothetical protein
VVSSSAGAGLVTAVEYYHRHNEHFFVTANPGEISLLDQETLAGWYRTGVQYRVHDSAETGTIPVCRYVSTAFGSKATHFYSALPQECDRLSVDADWTYEGTAFYVATPSAAGQCETGLAPIYRAYNNGRAGAPNHAYTPHTDRIGELVAAGFVLEGPVFCVPTSMERAASKTEAIVGYAFGLPWWAWSPWELTVTASAAEVSIGEPYVRALLRALPVAKKAEPSFDHLFQSAGWDPLIDAYRMFNVYRQVPADYAGDWVGTLWISGDPATAGASVCAYGVERNIDERYPGGVHPYQEIVIRGRYADCGGLNWTAP